MSVALVIQHAKSLRHITFSSVAFPAVPYFSTLSHKRHDFRGVGGIIEREMFALTSSINLSDTFLIRRRIPWDTVISAYRYSCKVMLFLSDFNQIWIFTTDFLKVLRYQISWIYVQWHPDCTMRADRRTDGRTNVTKVIVAVGDS